MKNTIKKIGIIAFVAIMALGLFTGCPEEPSDPPTPPTTITISGLTSGTPANLSGKYVAVPLYKTTGPRISTSYVRQISAATQTWEVIDDNRNALTIDEPCNILIHVSETNNPATWTTYYMTSALKNITPGDNKLNFSEFTVYTQP